MEPRRRPTAGQASYEAQAAVTQHACHLFLLFSLLALLQPLPLPSPGLQLEIFSLQRYQHIVLRMIAKISKFAKLLISSCTNELQLFIV